MSSTDLGYRSGEANHLSEVRIVLLGCRNAGKSSSGNTILGREDFDLQESAQCVMRQGEVAGRKITVVEAPGWQRIKAVRNSTELLKQEIVHSVSMCPPGPHVVLLVLHLDFKSWKSEKNVLQGYLNLLGDNVWHHTIVLFTFGDSLGDTTLERHIERGEEYIQWLIEKCGNRYHVFNNKKRDDDSQVTELLEKIEVMVAGNRGCHLEMDTKILQDAEERRREEEERSKKRMMKVSKKRENVRSHMFDKRHLLDVRIVLLGYRNAGKSSSGNTILGNNTFEFNRSDKCVKRQGQVAGRNITVVEVPGWQRNCKSHKRQCTELIKQEIVHSLSMCSPFPHAVLLVMCLDFTFREKHRKELASYLNLLRVRVWSHIIVLFTYGDSLGETTIERHIESEGEALQWLIEKCGNRYHVFNNKNSHDNTQVKELLEKIEEMVAENRSCLLEMDTVLLQNSEQRRKSRPEMGTTKIYHQGPLPEAYEWNPRFKKSLASLYQNKAMGTVPVFNESASQPLYLTHFQSPETFYSADTELLIPELGEIRSENKYRHEYRVLCLHAGQFMCKSTDLVFEMEEKVTVLYKIVFWDSLQLGRLLLGQIEPAGPLYSIDCPEGSICHLHLPHCETRKDVVKLTVAHVTGGNVEIIQPLKVTNTHVIINIQGLSLFGLLKSLLLQAYPIRAQVLLFYQKSMRKLHIHLLPGNVPVEEVQKRHESNTYIITSSKCKLTPGKRYRPCCKTTDCDYVSQPEDETFDCDYGPNYHPTFEVLFNTAVNKVTLSVLDEKDQVVWTPRMVLLTGTERALTRMDTTRMDTTGADFVDQHRATLIQRVSSVMEIADCLKSKKKISDEMYSNISEESTSYKKMRLLYRALDSGGRAVKAEFYKILREKEPYIVDDLESGLSLA